MKAAVLPVPLCDWAIRFCGGSAIRIGSAVSCIFEGLLNPIPYTPFNNSGRKLRSSNDFTE
ncbi:unnamed protein product [Larinioides sclopetarius]|uniref:Uncharacterized protein n=1 Tax=Larinioides sclopetarius TaxID=280406 RepID=A0AAV2BH86_9ARAC